MVIVIYFLICNCVYIYKSLDKDWIKLNNTVKKKLKNKIIPNKKLLITFCKKKEIINNL